VRERDIDLDYLAGLISLKISYPITKTGNQTGMVISVITIA
jgi:hypothetical protein